MKDEKELRDFYAVEIMKTLLLNQGRRRKMSIFDRIKWWFGGKKWKIEYQYNFSDCSKSAFECADIMIEERSKSLTPKQN